MYVETDKKQTAAYCIFACHWAANFGTIQFNANFYHGNVKTIQLLIPCV